MTCFKEWIEKLYSILRDEDVLIIDIKVKGIPDSLKCKIPNVGDATVVDRPPPIAKNYIVKEGDSLTTITLRHGRKESDCRELYEIPENKVIIANSRCKLTPGITLVIPDNWLRDWYDGE